MEKNHIKIKIDANGNVHREIVEEPTQQPQRSKLLKRIATAFSLGTT
ncbi:MAG: hypothetical protein GWN55_08390 [Phycisphaerae bacterium]|nr:hypothetical protein [Phycisphaerae bacterium]NIV68682.1 hypothetical protein [Phycisphaerae bacterium]